MYCGNCGKKVEAQEGIKNVISETVQKTRDEKIEQGGKTKKLKFNIGEVINRKDLEVSTTNKVAYIAKGWAIQVKDRGSTFAIIALFICVLLGITLQSNSGTYDDTQYWLIYGAYGIIAFFVILAVFNTVAFIIRMGAEIIQLLDDIKNKKEGNK